MCERGNGTIFAPCREFALRLTGMKRLSDKEYHRILRENGGCALRPEQMSGGRYVFLAPASGGDGLYPIDNQEKTVI